MTGRMPALLALFIFLAACSTSRGDMEPLRIPMADDEGRRAAVIYLDEGRSALARPGSDALVWLGGAAAPRPHMYSIPLTATLIITYDQRECREGRTWSLSAPDGRALEAHCLSPYEAEIAPRVLARIGNGARLVVWRSEDGSRSTYHTIFNSRGDFVGISFGTSDVLAPGAAWLVEGEPVSVRQIVVAVRGGR